MIIDMLKLHAGGPERLVIPTSAMTRPMPAFRRQLPAPPAVQAETAGTLVA
jgi:hypothetical protein